MIVSCSTKTHWVVPSDLCGKIQPKPYFEGEVRLATVLTGIAGSFRDCFEPNESPLRLGDKLKGLPPGWIISTGSERSFFDLLLSDEGQTEGVIIRDINPRMQLYNNTLILLLRLAENHRHFVRLIESQEDVRQLLDQDTTIPKDMQAYYKGHLESMLGAYSQCARKWKQDVRFHHVNYIYHEELFLKLQRYAQSGRLIHTVGKIDDLSFLGELPIRVVDSSNIWCYVKLDFPDGLYVISTDFTNSIQSADSVWEPAYGLTRWQRLSDQERREFEILDNLIDSAMPCIAKHSLWRFKDPDDLFNTMLVGYNKKTLEAMREYCGIRPERL